MSSFKEYEEFIESALYENPIVMLEKINPKGESLPIDNQDIIKYSILIRKLWNNYKRQDVQINITITNEDAKCSEKVLIFDYDFFELIRSIKEDGNYKSADIKVDRHGYITEIRNLKDKISIKYSTIKSREENTVCFFLSFKGIDVLMNGILFESDNHINSYKDVASNKFLSIFEYKKLLQNFYVEEVRYDTDKYFFAYPNQLPNKHKNLLKKYNKLLFAAPEERFQNRLVRYLKNNCEDGIEEEVRNADKDRYDIWILTEDKKLFVIEIKWLGQSVNAEGNISSNYNSRRFLDGAYQLKEYVDNSDTYSSLFKDIKIFHGILLTYDAREEDNSIIEFPKEFECYPNLDLKSQHYILEKEKVKASDIFKYKKRLLKTNKSDALSL